MLLRFAEAPPLLISAVSATMLAGATLTAGPMKDRPAASAPPHVAATVSEADVPSGIPLNQISDPSSTLSAATVQTSKGEKIGEVRAVEIGNDGRPRAVKVATSGLFGLGTLTKSISADNLIYVKARHTLVSRLTKAEIGALPPSAKEES